MIASLVNPPVHCGTIAFVFGVFFSVWPGADSHFLWRSLQHVIPVCSGPINSNVLFRGGRVKASDDIRAWFVSTQTDRDGGKIPLVHVPVGEIVKELKRKI